MDRVDLLIILGLIFAIFRGRRIGVLVLALSTLGFIFGLLLGSWLSIHLISKGLNTTGKLLLIIMTEILFAFLFSYIGEFFGHKLTLKNKKDTVDKLNKALGIVFEILAVFIIIWLIIPSLTSVRTHSIGYYVQRSLIVGEIDKILPSPPDIFSRLENVVSPNSFPNVFIGLEPQHTTVSPTTTLNNNAIAADEKSVVKVIGQGCGGLVEGSGFVVGNGFVATNAHVIAGISDPEVVDSSGTYKAFAINFNPYLDFAVLRVDGLSDPPLKLNTNQLIPGDAAGVLGYPGNGDLTFDKAVIIDQVTAEGQNIYNQGVVDRQIYEIQSNVQPGNSGGPLLASDGSVAGVVFAKSVSQPGIGYALLTSDIKDSINSAEKQNTAVSTGSCASG